MSPYKSGGQVYTWTTVEHVSLSCLSRARVVVKVAEQPRFLQERAAAGLRGAAVDLVAVPRLAPRPRPRPWPVSGAAGWAGLAAWSWEPAGDGDGDWERLGGRGLLERERERDLSSISAMLYVCHNMSQTDQICRGHREVTIQR